MSFHKAKGFSTVLTPLSLSAHAYMCKYIHFYTYADISTHIHNTNIYLHEHTSIDKQSIKYEYVS